MGTGMTQADVHRMAQSLTKDNLSVTDLSHAPMIGNKDGAVQIVEFSDFLCPACKKAERFNEIILPSHKMDVGFFFKHYPLDMECNDRIKHSVHPGACQAAAASICAGEQGKFWEFHHRMFKKESFDPAKLESDVVALGLNLDTFRQCVSSGRAQEAVKQDIADAATMGITATPTYIVNGITLNGFLTPKAFEELLPAFLDVREKFVEKSRK